MTRWPIRLAAGLVILSLVAMPVEGQSYCEPVDSTGLPYAVIIDLIAICGGGPAPGDQVCLFDGDLAVGAYTLSPSSLFPITVTAWQADPAHGLDGFEPGNPIIFSYYSAARQELMILQARLGVGDGKYGTAPYTLVDSLVEVGYSPPELLGPFDPVNLATCGNEIVCVPIIASHFDSIAVENGAYINGEVCFPIGDETRFYTAWVIAYNDCGTDSCTVTIDPIYPAPTAACFANPAVGEPPFEVLFVNCSSPFAGVSYFWQFGDGTSSTAREPRHVYGNPGCYDVSLVVSNQCYADTIDVPNAVCVGDGEKCIQIDLAPEWNLISWNVSVAGSIQKVFADVMPCVDVILGYNNGGLTYDPLQPQLSDLLEVDYLHGYWIKMNCPDTLVLCDSAVSPATGIPINQDWNLVSYLPPSDGLTIDALASLSGMLELAFSFENGILAYNPGLPGFTTMTHMHPGTGYWIRATGSGELWYPGFGSSGTDAPTSTQMAPEYAGPNWFSVYAKSLTVDGTPLSAGTQIEFRSIDGETLGESTLNGEALRFTPVYERSQSIPFTSPDPGEPIEIWVDGQRVYPLLSRPDRYDRLELPALTSTDLTVGLPDGFYLGQNYPNPFNPSTRIDFTLPQSTHVRIEVYNLVGQRVSKLIDQPLPAGNHFVIWEALDNNRDPLPSGLYVYRIRTAEWTAARKMTLVK